MKVKDKVWGNFTVNEPVLVKIINSAPVQRMKNISQSGLPGDLGYLPTYSRYEHSIGVLFLTQYFELDLKHQISALIHDIGHLAFSHLGEWVMGNDKESLHDDLGRKVILDSEITEILERYNFRPVDFLNIDSNEFIKPKKGDLGLDRLDYGTRDSYLYKDKTINSILKSLKLLGNRFVFEDMNSARKFALAFLDQQVTNWGSFEASYRYYILSRLLRYSIKHAHITKQDFSRDEETILQKLYDSNDRHLLKILNRLKRNCLADYEKSLGINVQKKFRYVDPWAMNRREIVKLSEIDYEFKAKLLDAREKSDKGFII